MELNQFIHTNSYSLTSPKKAKEGNHSVKSIIAEATREPGNCPHVPNPQAPVILFGCSPAEIEKKCESWASTVTDAAGRKLRKDALCLVAGVVSAPAGMVDWPAYRDASLEFLKKKYGDSLASVVEHIDEDQPHIHFYVIAAPGARFETIHEGRAAADAVIGKNMKASKDVAYSAAMTLFQDNFYDHVSKQFGFNRIGPGAPRVTRAEAMKRKEIRKVVEADIKRELPLAIKRGIHEGRKKGFFAGTTKGREDFEKKSLFAKLTDFVTRLTKQNSSLIGEVEILKKESSSMTDKFDRMKAKASSFFSELKILRPEIIELRSKNAKLVSTNSDLQKSLTNLELTQKDLSSANSRILHLEAVVDGYREEEQRNLDTEKAQERVAKQNKSRISNAGIDYS